MNVIRSGVSKYLVQWEKEESFGRSQAGGDVSHADAAGWSAVVVDTHYQVRAYAIIHMYEAYIHKKSDAVLTVTLLDRIQNRYIATRQ